MSTARRLVSRLAARRRTGPVVEDSRMTLVEHLQELRSRLLKAMIAVAVITLIVAVWAYTPVIHVLEHPYQHLPRHLRGPANGQLIFTHPTGAFVIRLKVSLIAGSILSAPFWLYQVWAFIAPGLHRRERRWTITFVGASLVLFGIGCTVAYFVLGKALEILLGFGGNGLTPLLDANEYLSFITTILVIFGFAFEFPLLVVMLNLAGIVSYERLRHWRRATVFGIFAFAAVATPTQDPLTMLALAVPLCVLNEGAILIARWHDKRKAREDPLAGLRDLPDDQPSPQPVDDAWHPEPATTDLGPDADPGSDPGTDDDTDRRSHYADST